MSFTVAAQSKPEIMVMYRKLNYLASNLAPEYTSAGYMAGPLVQLTMGGWCYELPGFISSLTLEVPQESPWEIGINDVGKFDDTVKEMPHIIKVTGLSFTPIHTFRPAKMKLTKAMTKPDSNLRDENKYGSERYIALKAGNNNYDNKVNWWDKKSDGFQETATLDAIKDTKKASPIPVISDPPALRIPPPGSGVSPVGEDLNINTDIDTLPNIDNLA
tara:strand:- start:439 stop:1089 length:651 start_codon:yes stop_codon:yes gene_type:complete